MIGINVPCRCRWPQSSDLYARLATIERVLGVRLDSVESRTSLSVALMITDALSERPYRP